MMIKFCLMPDTGTKIPVIHKPLRRRGIYLPPDEVEPHLANGRLLIDDCPGFRGALIAPPPQRPFSNGVNQ
jgi:hypothetical protein